MNSGFAYKAAIEEEVMIWIFAAVVLVLAVFNEGFRKLVFVAGGIAIAFCAFLLMIGPH